MCFCNASNKNGALCHFRAWLSTVKSHLKTMPCKYGLLVWWAGRGSEKFLKMCNVTNTQHPHYEPLFATRVITPSSPGRWTVIKSILKLVLPKAAVRQTSPLTVFWLPPVFPPRSGYGNCSDNTSGHLSVDKTPGGVGRSPVLLQTMQNNWIQSTCMALQDLVHR